MDRAKMIEIWKQVYDENHDGLTWDASAGAYLTEVGGSGWDPLVNGVVWAPGMEGRLHVDGDIISEMMMDALEEAGLPKDFLPTQEELR